MMKSRTFLIACCFLCLGLVSRTAAQSYVSPTEPTPSGKAPGHRVKLLSDKDGVKTYALVFATGDEVKSGLTDFASRYKVEAASFTGLGDVTALKVGFYDYRRKQFKVIPIDTAEITSFAGNISLYNGKPTVHVHVSGSLSDGSVKGGHLLEMTVGPTFEVIVTVYPASMQKKLDQRFGAAVLRFEE